MFLKDASNVVAEIDERPRLDEVIAALGYPHPPKQVLQEAFDDRGLLVRLVTEGRLNAPALEAPLEEFCLCLRYVEHLQLDLFRHGLPLCLAAWQETLFSGRYMDVTTTFHSALALRRSLISDLLGTSVEAKVRAFMAQSIIACMQKEHNLVVRDSPPHHWTFFIATYGCIWDDVAIIYSAWRLGNLGLSVAALQYVSIFAYADSDNELFKCDRLARSKCVPRPWECLMREGELISWLPGNISFLREFMMIDKIIDWARDAADKLATHPESDLALKVCEDFVLQQDLIRVRAQDFIRHLGSTADFRYWSDEYGIV